MNHLESHSTSGWSPFPSLRGKLHENSSADGDASSMGSATSEEAASSKSGTPSPSLREILHKYPIAGSDAPSNGAVQDGSSWHHSTTLYDQTSCPFQQAAGLGLSLNTLIGSLGHEVGKCTPCRYWFAGRCLHGTGCRFCHLSHEGEEVMVRSRLSKKERMRFTRRKELLVVGAIAKTVEERSGTISF
mmetsp:Transcript_28422/g.78319  ORF Transcript_28422/g.78319 Transcript_28422/m.78319 type:complete len:188 (+) Transcript_28422:26-589(+)